MRKLEYCPECKCARVYPTAWKEKDKGSWYLHLRCPDCEHFFHGLYTEDEVIRFDDKLNKGTDQLIDDLWNMTQTNMREWSERFSLALQNDQIEPSDF